ncbi:MAG: linear amide C-N hydrolase, partial [Firmicutes bacterium]|nr:linear amide C-N hydrolase [Candidatus Colivicinus equi]
EDKITYKANKNLAVNQNEPNKKTILHPVLMRRMLDYCKDVDEAIELAKTYNVKSPMPDSDYHIMLSDKSGKSVILEWVDNKMNVVETNHGTNYYLSRDDHYGYGQDRDEVVTNNLKDVMSEKEVMNLLEEVSQNPFKKKYIGFTQWSSVYNLNKNTLKLSIFLDYDKQYEFKI